MQHSTYIILEVCSGDSLSRDVSYHEVPSAEHVAPHNVASEKYASEVP